MPLKNAKDLGLFSNNLPQVDEVIMDWFLPVSFGKVTKQLLNFKVQEVVETIETQGVVQPLSPRELEMKPEGQRAFTWLMVHCLPNVQLKTDDILIYNSTRFRVMASNDYSAYGYLEYHLMQDYGVEDVD